MRRDKKFSSVTIILTVNWLFMRRQCGQVRGDAPAKKKEKEKRNRASAIECLTRKGKVRPNPDDPNWIRESD